jgi:methionyl-tRNA formyltransferase
VTWFWCDEGTDNGPICEQEILPLDLFTRPGEFCAREVLPALARTLTWALADLARVSARRRPQYEAAVTHERPIATKQHSFRGGWSLYHWSVVPVPAAA